MHKGIVLSSNGGLFEVLYKEKIYICSGSGKLRDTKNKIIVGDYVLLEKTNKNEGYIKDILKRENKLTRPSIANVDQALIIISLKEPSFSSYLMEKLILQAVDLDIKPVVYLSKKDKLSKEELKKTKEKMKIYREDGVEIYFGNSLNLKNKRKFRKILKNKKTIVCGQSGSGKSTFLNALNKKLNLEVGDYSKSLGRGKHTTRVVRYLRVFDALIADTPGFSSLVLDIDPLRVAKIYPLFKDYYNNCKFQSSCIHMSEIGCNIKKKVKENKIPKETYENYKKILNEIKESKKGVYR